MVRRRHDFTGMARIEELPVDKKVAALFNGAEGVDGLVTMLAVSHLPCLPVLLHIAFPTF